MKIALISAVFKNGKTEENIRVMTECIIQASNAGADMAVFGESAMQGFDALVWEYQKDVKTAMPANSDGCMQLMNTSKQYEIAVSFGFFERVDDAIYSSQITIGKDGRILDVFRRVSEGWKTEQADAHYREGSGFSCFEFMGKRFAVALCGDLWYDEHVLDIAKLHPDIVLWPVYCDYDADEWNSAIKHEYAQQVKDLYAHVLWVNPFCGDEGEIDAPCAVGGGAHFKQGTIVAEHAAGTPDMLIVEI